MRIRFLLALLCFSLASGYSAYAQKVTINLQNVKLEKVFDAITKQTGLSVAYSRPTVNPDQNVSISATNEELGDVLKRLFAGTNVAFEIGEEKIYLKDGKTSSNGSQQVKKKNVSGVIVDTNGEPVIGASVLVKGTTNGTITDMDGKFTINDVPENSTLDISYIGYKTMTLKATDKNLSRLVLHEDTEVLDEVVVVGYGVQRKRDVSTAVSSVKAEALANNPASDFRQALVGKMPGVQVTTPSGDPEGSVSIRVRGISTVNAGSDPLYIVDGVPMERGFANMNTNDIESIEVLKDASAAAIYGSRGSNGVVLITTKKGTSEKLTVQYDGYYGIQNVSKKLPMMNAYQFAEFARDGHNNAYLAEVPGASPDDPNSVRPQSYHQIPAELFPYLEGQPGLTDTDWQDAIFRTANTTGHNISLSGKANSVNYFVSGNYMNKEGIIINSDFKKYSMRMNIDGKYKRLKFGVNFAPSYSTSNSVDASGAGGIVQSALMMPPVWPVYNEDGSYNYQGNGYWRIGTDYQHNEVLNPVAMANLQSNVTDRMSIIGKVYAELELYKGLTYKISFGGDYYGAHNDKYRQSALPLKGKNYYDMPSNPEGYSSSSFYFNWLIENQLTYNTTINEKHNLTAILVQSAQKETFKSNNVTATDYPNDYIQTISGGTVTKGYSEKSQWSIASYLARVQYSFSGKYMLSGAIRTDGSSRFGKNNRWGYFPSASAAWRITEENFFKEQTALSFINDLKLRLSYGVTGNFQIGNYEHLATMSLDNYILGTGQGLLSYGYKPDNIEREDLSWEKNKMVNAGVDVQMFNGLLGFTVDYYNTNTSDMLLSVPVPLITGYSTSLMNIGKVNNRGWEIGLSSQKHISDDFGYSFNANWSKNINEVKALGPSNAPIISSGSVEHAYYITEVGKPIGNYYLLVQDGIFETEEDLKKYPHFENTKVGDFRFVDVDGDGVLDLDKDRTVCGNYMPKFTYGFGGKLWYKGFDLDINFQGVFGNKILNLNRRYIDNMEGNVNGTTIALDRWQREDQPGNGQVNKANRKQTGYNGRTSTWHLENGSYLRLQNVSLGYTFPKKWTNRFYVEKLRLYVSGQNLATFTKYSGYNPEVNARPDNALTPGEDYGTYPLARTFMFGINVTL
ncbi:TonB-dependent receptor [Bacteroides sp. ET336]|uniref:TonB-dependent receptor n=1 Tax=Bacteroides sp. ET336 TaxID=2972459 RepID=UPI0021AC4F71|nr:TonB-dependent receptor [Bacteroides sp. ET336]MCR8892821.1 TonB-dependent receptor [Bacteroides sp. ET336]MDN0057318.1 TonB-dependent receptor [Bacteroides caecigallinarum]